jgi:hypothetical protein
VYYEHLRIAYIKFIISSYLKRAEGGGEDHYLSPGAKNFSFCSVLDISITNDKTKAEIRKSICGKSFINFSCTFGRRL